MKNIFFVLVLISSIYADKLEVTADKFTAKDADKMVIFEGHARIVQGSTTINASKIVVHFDDANSAKSYNATGGVNFRIKKLKANYRGSCNKMTYLPAKQSYILRGDVKVKDSLNSREISGQKINIYAKTGGFTIVGAKSKQAKLIFDMK